MKRGMQIKQLGQILVAWKKKYGKGKVFYISIGHDPNEFIRYPDGWKLLTRGFVWACRN